MSSLKTGLCLFLTLHFETMHNKYLPSVLPRESPGIRVDQTLAKITIGIAKPWRARISEVGGRKQEVERSLRKAGGSFLFSSNLT